jgi:flagellar biogenesis protein FliO
LILKLVNVVIILSCLGGLLWFIKHKAKKYGNSYVRSSGHVEIVDDGLQIGVNHKVSVIRVGEELFLHSYGPSGVAFQKLEQKELIDRGEKWEEAFPGQDLKKPSFKDALKAIKGKGERL